MSEAPRRAPSYLRPMDAMELQAMIPQFPGYLDEAARRLSDELVRSYAGEALAGLVDCLRPLDTALEARFDAVLMRAGFANQGAFRGYESAVLSPERSAAMLRADTLLATLAKRAASVDIQSAPGYLDELVAAFDARDSAMQQVAA